MKTIVFPEFPEKLTGKYLNGLLGELASFASADNINALDDDEMDKFRGVFRAFNSRMQGMVVAVGREIVGQMPGRDYAKDYALFKKLLEGEKRGSLNRAGRIRLKLLRTRLKGQEDASASLLFVRYLTERQVWYAEQVEHALSRKYLNEDALFKLLPEQVKDMRVMLSAFSEDGEDENVKAVSDAIEHKNPDALLKHARSLAGVLHKNSKKLSGILPNLDELVSAAESMFPKRFAGNVEASADTGSLTKTFLVWFAVVSVVYWLNYLFITIISKSGIKGVAKILAPV